MELIDSHSHIYGKEYAQDLDQVLARAREAGVTTIMAVGADLESSREACALAAAHDNIYCSVGIHPHDADRVTEKCYEVVREMALSNPKVVAIGEIGLDFYRDRSPRPAQEEVFRRFIRLARELSLPLIIHDRDAHDRIVAILKEEQASEVGGVLHCFSGDLGMARECIEMGFKISIPGTVTYASNEALREVVRGIKIEEMLVETDAPYLTPVPHRGKRNEPAYVRLTAERVAEIKGLSLEDVGRITSLNTRRLFGIGTSHDDTIAYMIRNSLYLNITNRCSNHCTFCAKFQDFTVKGHELKLSHEPSFAEVMEAVDAVRAEYSEVVFCGYGEPMIRLDLIKEVAAELKRRGGLRVRINTDGQANLVHARNVLPELAGLIDVVSVSLNAADAETYERLCNTPYGAAGFQGVCDFLVEAKKHIPVVVASAVGVPGLDVARVRELAESLGVEFREREYAEVG